MIFQNQRRGRFFLLLLDPIFPFPFRYTSSSSRSSERSIVVFAPRHFSRLSSPSSRTINLYWANRILSITAGRLAACARRAHMRRKGFERANINLAADIPPPPFLFPRRIAIIVLAASAAGEEEGGIRGGNGRRCICLASDLLEGSTRSSIRWQQVGRASTY